MFSVQLLGFKVLGSKVRKIRIWLTLNGEPGTGNLKKVSGVPRQADFGAEKWPI